MPPVTCTPPGGPGKALGVTGDAVPAGPVPLALVAVTEQVYCVPLTRLVTVTLSVVPFTGADWLPPPSLVRAHVAV